MISSSHYNKSVLIADDSPDTIAIASYFFKNMHIDFSIASSGAEALQITKTTPFALYLVTSNLPDISTENFITEISKTYRDPVVIIQSTDSSADTVIEMMKLGVFDYLIKPYSFDIFAAAIKRSIEFSRLKQLEHEHLQYFRSELAKIREIQAHSIPDTSKFYGLDIAYSILPAEELAGDVLGIFEGGNSRLVFILCDINGHGIASGYIGNEIKSLFRTLYADEHSPAKLIEQVNKTLLARSKSTVYLSTVVVCYVHIDTGAVCISSAGHPPALHHAQRTGEIFEIKPKGTMLCIAHDSRFEEQSFTLEEGDSLILYTDGISEACNEKKELFDAQRIRKAIEQSEAQNAHDKLFDILNDVYQFTDYTAQEDDMSIVVIRKTNKNQ